MKTLVAITLTFAGSAQAHLSEQPLVEHALEHGWTLLLLLPLLLLLLPLRRSGR